MNLEKKLYEVPESFKNFGRLPGRPSKLLKVAIADLQASVKAGMKVDMNLYYRKNDAECTVCLAGAVMARSLNAAAKIKKVAGDSEGDRMLYSSSFPREELALMALDDLRVGDIQMAFAHLGLRKPEEYNMVGSVSVPYYEEGHKEFVQAMKALAKELERLGF